MFFHISGAEKFVKSSFQNEEEATFIAYLYKELQKSIGKEVNVHDYCGIITPYSRQVKEIRRKIKVIENLEKCPLEVNSVDGYQGREKNMIIFSTVRASQIALEQTGQEDKIVKNNRKKIGFLNDARRMNVSLSRAKACLIVIGDLNQLRHHQKWKNLMDIAVEQDSCYQVKGKAQNFLSKFSKNPETFKIKNLEDIVDVRN
ncbi:P-loop containing nucleoside triphosphate hydrolase [Pseudocohnilembus persalinus]|uniref:p-loop containing nucleoside triphosphate hydrolase n=1 Tax=Pseudocohnilembus persalinus TaxID=266149 RepID=A0A0V0QPZ7_PSEPJ|nr:P-loop containing nucleoside triphosphate hydrolase [Pseudocohnilembus persalinus]|eukprot:KRX04236.1 P-loop containing nucleoside triphosphate hydrolase [Pseudocohnilembus persalinus]